METRKRWHVLFIFTLCTSIFLCYYGRDKKYSYFYEPDLNIIKAENRERVRRSVNYFEKQKTAGLQYSKAVNGGESLCVAFIVSSPRYLDYNQRYFIQSVASVLSRMSPRQRQKTHVAIISSEANITVGAKGPAIVDEDTIRPFVDSWKRRIRPYGSGNMGTLREESHDYYRALQHCYQSTDAPMVLVVEDDAVASPALFRNIFKIGKQVVESDKGAFYIKLFASEAYFGWENRDIPLMILIGFGVGALWYFAWFFYYSRFQRNCLTMLRGGPLIWICEILFLVIFTVAALKITGKQHVFPPFSKGVHQIPWGAIDSNTVATLYPFRDKIPEFLDFLSKTLVRKRTSRVFQKHLVGSKPSGSFAIDMILHRWTTKMKLSRYYCIPSLFQHIGVFSSKGWKNLAPYKTLYKNMKTSATFGKID